MASPTVGFSMSSNKGQYQPRGSAERLIILYTDPVAKRTVLARIKLKGVSTEADTMNCGKLSV